MLVYIIESKKEHPVKGALFVDKIRSFSEKTLP